MWWFEMHKMLNFICIQFGRRYLFVRDNLPRWCIGIFRFTSTSGCRELMCRLVNNDETFFDWRSRLYPIMNWFVVRKAREKHWIKNLFRFQLCLSDIAICRRPDWTDQLEFCGCHKPFLLTTVTGDHVVIPTFSNDFTHFWCKCCKKTTMIYFSWFYSDNHIFFYLKVSNMALICVYFKFYEN